MEYRRFGSTGLRVSRFCMGTMGYGTSAWRKWVLDRQGSEPILKQALDLGINFFDMADFYSQGENEAVVGPALLSMVPRDSLVLASKAYYPMSDEPNNQGLSRKHLFSAIDISLQRIGTDYLDLYMIHAFDPNTPMEETMEALNDLVRSGKVRYLGASTMYSWQFAKFNALAEKNGWAKFINMQCQYSLIYREEEREMMPYCRSEGIAVSTFSPLARGLLSGVNDLRMKTDSFTTEFFGDQIDLAIAQRVQKLAKSRGVSPAEIAMAWVANNCNVDTPLIGAQTIAQLDTAVSCADLVLSADENRYLEELYRPCDVINDHNPIHRSRALGEADHASVPIVLSGGLL